MKRLAWLIIAPLLLIGPGCNIWHQGPIPYDVVVLGETPSGIAAAAAAARAGARVCLIAEQDHLGGMMASGLGSTDSGNPDLIGGLAREIFHSIALHYRNSYGPESSQFGQSSQGLCFEPHVAEEIFDRLVEKEEIALYRGWLFDDCALELNKVIKLYIRHRHSAEIDSISAKIFIDGTYTGDLFATAGAPFSLGREGREVYGESLAGHIYQDPETCMPLPGSTGRGDSLIQAYNFRLCLTDSLQNTAPLPEPENYDPSRYKVLYQYIQAKREVSPGDFMIFSPLPNRKYDINNWGYCWLSTDLIGGSQDYPEATYEERARIEKMHLEHILGLLKFLRTDPGIPESLRDRFGKFNPAADEFTDNRHLPFQIYVREARRLNAPYTFTQSDATLDTLKEDTIGMGSYPMDSHATGSWNYSYPWAEGFFIMPSRSYQIPYAVMLPAWTRNLLVSACVSASHVGYGTLRMEPVLIIMGQAAGVAAALCSKYNCQVDEVPVSEMQHILRKQGAILTLAEARPWAEGL
ncbi:MAG TPA: FAD-dependent oxidoreductase [archaeon]|nr:FAD-dependent oxidoreductase [archaeon]